MEMGRGGACVPARVALQGRIHRSFPAHNATSPMNAGRYMRLRCDWPAPVPLYRLLVVLKR